MKNKQKIITEMAGKLHTKEWVSKTLDTFEQEVREDEVNKALKIVHRVLNPEMVAEHRGMFKLIRSSLKPLNQPDK